MSSNESKRSGQVPGHKQGSETFDPDLEWLLLAGASAMGERGTLAGTIAQLQLGGPVGGVPSTDLYSDQQIGWGKTVLGSVERHRWLLAAWESLDRKTRTELEFCYSAPPAAFRSDQGFGARDESPTAEDIALGAHEPQRGKHASTRTGTDARLGRLAALALRIVDRPDRLLIACHDPQKGGHSKVITRALKQAQGVAQEAHRQWYEAKGELRAPRKTSERRKVLPAVVGGDE